MAVIRWLLIGLLALASASCSESARTQVMITVDSDLRVPEELDGLEILVRGPEDEPREAAAVLGAGEPGLPRSLALSHEGGPPGPFQVTARGLKGDMEVVTREAVFDFQPGRTLVLTMNLVRSCVGESCEGDDQTCTEQGCRSKNVKPNELRPWSGSPPRLGDQPDAGGMDAMVGVEGGADTGTPDSGTDTSVPDTGTDSGMVDSGTDTGTTDSGTDTGTSDGSMEACVPQLMETCNGMDDDCDGFIDEGFDLNVDKRHCGECNNVCVNGYCLSRSCVECGADVRDCNDDPADGCETNITTDTDCGSCGKRCNGQFSCVNKTCQKRGQPL